MIPEAVWRAVETRAQAQGIFQKYETSVPVGGGCIHNASMISTDQGKFFLKWNHAGEFENFQAEIRGLGLLRQAGQLNVPNPFFSGIEGKYAFLLMEFLEAGRKSGDFWEKFGRSLAGLHRQTRDEYGLESDNFIGRLPQKNDFRNSWVEFFAEMRLEVQISMARDQGLLDADTAGKFQALKSKLPDLMPEEPASLLHGDLWSGNFMTGPDGYAAIFDPAVYYGHREAEIAFTRLFGGFAPEFYHAYLEEWPLASGWEARIDLFNLYPLMVHLNLFGRSYLPEIQSTLRRFT